MNHVILENHLAAGVRLQLVEGDLTEEAVDAIVNAANSRLEHGGGVAGAISRRGGPQIQAESNEWVHRFGPVRHDYPAYTSGGRLPCRYVIHAVGPVWGEGDEDAKLAAAVHGSLQRAEELKLQSLALPAISTGIYGFPKQRAATVILGAIQEYFAGRQRGSLETVRLTLIDQPTLAACRSAWEGMFPGEEGSD
jgi:O-acetyl-ADP-ribose deacetylase (regulator of RNase III)